MSTSLALICTIWDSQNFFRDNSTNIWRYLYSQTPPHDFYCHLPIRNQTNLFNYYFFERFPVLFPRPVPIPGSYVSETFSLTRHAKCTFKSDIILGRLFSFQGAWESIPSPIQLFSAPYTTKFPNFYLLFLFLIYSVASNPIASLTAWIAHLINLLAAC